MNLYDINKEILSLIDKDTGEITDLDRFEELSIGKHKKLENLALYIKNEEAIAEALKRESKILADRAKAKENKINHLKNYISNYMIENDISRIETPKGVISFRKSKAVVCDNEEAFIYYCKRNKFDFLIKTKVTEMLDKKAIKEWLENYYSPICRVEEKQNIQIK